MGKKIEKPYNYYDVLGRPQKDGRLEGGASVWLVRREGERVFVLFQKRSQFVQNAGFYDSSAGGHIDEGEAPLAAALRETKEEIGLQLQPEDLRFVCAYATDKKYIHVYLADRTRHKDQFTLNQDEVESIEWVALEDFEQFIPAKVKPPLRGNIAHLPVLRAYIEKYL